MDVSLLHLFPFSKNKTNEIFKKSNKIISKKEFIKLNKKMKKNKMGKRSEQASHQRKYTMANKRMKTDTLHL